MTNSYKDLENKAVYLILAVILPFLWFSYLLDIPNNTGVGSFHREIKKFNGSQS